MLSDCSTPILCYPSTHTSRTGVSALGYAAASESSAATDEWNPPSHPQIQWSLPAYRQTPLRSFIWGFRLGFPNRSMTQVSISNELEI
ncbi:hypothetical protein CDAR_565591 [Caerostris darwini]|uniref:Uncharacterized protein n=1 Tax=Caerostris darwini TaxID=1538125 RepID=A0AAV4UZ72_9ARAC|nr:hypothetical protein CDAR_565591 [Caerostris darwini]